jgi:hypothetical protein
MKILTIDALLVCDHELGHVSNQATQDLVTVAGRKVLVENNPEGRTIARCPNISATMKPCQHTLKVQQGYSTFIRIMGHAICLDTVTGMTDGTPPGTVHYKVRSPGQTLVEAGA